MGSIFQSFQSKQGLPLSPPAAHHHHRRPLSNSNNNNNNNKKEEAGQVQGQGQGRGQEQGCIRRRLSSFSLKLQLHPPTMMMMKSSSPSSSWVGGALRRSKSVSSMGEYVGNSIRKWWDWGWAWILSRKPTFAKDLEMNQDETEALGCHHRGSWRHVFYKVKSEVGKFVGSSDNVGLPQTFRYDSYNYSKNFDHGKTTDVTRY